MRKSCKYCGRTHEAAVVCAHKPPHRRKSENKVNKFRSTSAWQKKREEIRGRDHYLCRFCASKGVFVYQNIEVHHIEPLAQRFDLRLDDDNLISLDEWCHELAEKGEISREELRELAKTGIPPLPFDAKNPMRANTTSAPYAHTKFRK